MRKEIDTNAFYSFDSNIMDKNGNIIMENSGNLLEKYVTNPIKNKIDETITSIGDWLKINVIQLAGIIVIVVIVSSAFYLFLDYKSKKAYRNIYVSIIVYLVMKLFWKVVLKA